VPVSASACFNLPHEWKEITRATVSPAGAMYALQDALSQLHQKFLAQLDLPASMPVSLAITSVTWPTDDPDDADTRRHRLQRSLPLAWHLSEGTAGGAPPVVHGGRRARNRPDGEAIFGPVVHGGRRARNRPDGEAIFGPVASWTGELEISQYSADQTHFLDLIFFSWIITRHIYREKAVVRLRIFDPQGGVEFVDEIAVSPTIIIDHLFAPIGQFTGHLEKHDSRPNIVDFGELFKNWKTDIRGDGAGKVPDYPTSP
jgi:hypothetical protein